MSDLNYGPDGIVIFPDKGTQPNAQTNSICVYSKNGQLTMTNSSGVETTFAPAILGEITMVFGDISIYPTATHALCDGTNGTPDMRGKVPRGWSDAVGQEYPGSPARRNNDQAADIQSHSHVIERDVEGSPGSNVAFAVNGGTSNFQPTATQATGGEETRGKNYALAFIMRYAL